MTIKVLFLHSGGEWLRGSENALLVALRGLDRRRITPLLFSSNRHFTTLAHGDGVETIDSPMPQVMIDGRDTRLQLLSWAALVLRLSRVIKRRNIGLVYCNGGSTCQVGYYAARLARVPLVCHLHAPYDRRYVVLYRLHRAAKVVFVSHAIEKSTTQKQAFVGNCEVVYNGVDTKEFRPEKERDAKSRQRWGLPADAVVFGQVSSLIARKGIDVLLRAFELVSRKNPTTRLVIVGDGPGRREYEALANQLGIGDHVVFTGNQSSPVLFYRDVFDVNVLASRSDAFPLSLLEASACGLPNIGASVDGIPESVTEEVTGLLFEAGNHEMLAAKMNSLLYSAEVRHTLGEAGRMRAIQEFSMEKYCRSIERIILEESAG